MAWDILKIKSYRSIGAVKNSLTFLKDGLDTLTTTVNGLTGGILTLGTTSTTAARGDQGLAAYNHSQEGAGDDPHGLLAAIRGGVDPQGDTLLKLYNLLLSIGQLVGDFNASSGVLPTTGTGISGGIDKGDMWHITEDGTLPVGVSPTNVVKTGDLLVAREANPSTATGYYVVQNRAGAATNTVAGVAKLYTDLTASNTDGSVTQAALVTAINALSANSANFTPGSSGLATLKRYLGLKGNNSGDNAGIGWVLQLTGPNTTPTVSGGVAMKTTIKLLPNGTILMDIYNTAGSYIAVISPSGKISAQKLIELWRIGNTYVDDIVLWRSGTGYTTVDTKLTPVRKTDGPETVDGYAESPDGLYFYTMDVTSGYRTLVKVNKSTRAVVWAKRIHLVAAIYAAANMYDNIFVTLSGHIGVSAVTGSDGYEGCFFFTSDGVEIGHTMNDDWSRHVYLLKYQHDAIGSYGYTYAWYGDNRDWAGLVSFSGSLIWGVVSSNPTSYPVQFLCDDEDGNVYFKIGTSYTCYRIYKYNRDRELLWVKSFQIVTDGSPLRTLTATATAASLFIYDHTNKLLLNLPADGNITDGIYGNVNITNYANPPELTVITAVASSEFISGAVSGATSSAGTYQSGSYPSFTASTNAGVTTYIKYPIDDGYMGGLLAASTSKTALVDADKLAIYNSVSGFLETVTWTNFLASVLSDLSVPSYVPGSAALATLKANLGLKGVNSGDTAGTAWALTLAGAAAQKYNDTNRTVIKRLTDGTVIINTPTSNTMHFTAIISPSGKLLKQFSWSYKLASISTDSIVFWDKVTESLAFTNKNMSPISKWTNPSGKGYAETADGMYYYTVSTASTFPSLVKVNAKTKVIVWSVRISTAALPYNWYADYYNIEVTDAGYVFVRVVMDVSQITVCFVFNSSGAAVAAIGVDTTNVPTPVVNSSTGEFWYTRVYYGDSRDGLAKVDTSLNILWAIQHSNPSSYHARLLCEDADGNFYVSWGNNTYNTVEGIVKYSKNYEVLWCKSLSPIYLNCALATTKSLYLFATSVPTSVTLICVPADGNFTTNTYGAFVFATLATSPFVSCTPTIGSSSVYISGAVTSNPAVSTSNGTVTYTVTDVTAVTTQYEYPLDDAYIGGLLSYAGAKTVPDNNDKIGILDSVSGLLQTITYQSLKSAIYTAGGTLGDTLNCNNQLMVNPVVKGSSIFQYDIGAISTTQTVSVNVQTNGNWQTLSCDANCTISIEFTNWPSTGLGYVELLLTNMGVGTLVFLDTIKWKLKNDTFTTSFATYLTDRGGELALKSSGIDRFMVEKFNNELYGTLI